MNKWIDWEDKIISDIGSVYNTREVPLRYVASKEYTGDVADMTREEEILYHTILNGPMFDQDYKEVM